jgi:hypothetical protein
VAEIVYTNYTNMDSLFMKPYEPGHRLVKGWCGTITVDDITNVDAVADLIFKKHNRDDRPDGQMCPSMSVGDVVVIGEVAVTVAVWGWKHVQLDPADVVERTDR